MLPSLGTNWSEIVRSGQANDIPIQQRPIQLTGNLVCGVSWNKWLGQAWYGIRGSLSEIYLNGLNFRSTLNWIKHYKHPWWWCGKITTNERVDQEIVKSQSVLKRCASISCCFAYWYILNTSPKIIWPNGWNHEWVILQLTNNSIRENTIFLRNWHGQSEIFIILQICVKSAPFCGYSGVLCWWLLVALNETPTPWFCRKAEPDWLNESSSKDDEKLVVVRGATAKLTAIVFSPDRKQQLAYTNRK